MLTENYRSTPPNTFEFKNISKDLVFWFESIVYENNCRIEKKNGKVNITAMWYMTMNPSALTVLK